MTDLFLKWNNHGSSFISLLGNLCSKELFYDATIACHGKYYPVHRLILSSFSGYFEEIFSRTKCKHPFIIIKDIIPTELEALLAYMYRGEVNIPQELLLDLIRAAEELKITGLALALHDKGSKVKTEGTNRVNSVIGPIDLSNSNLLEKDALSKSNNFGTVIPDIPCNFNTKSALPYQGIHTNEYSNNDIQDLQNLSMKNTRQSAQFSDISPVQVAEVKLEDQEIEQQENGSYGSFSSEGIHNSHVSELQSALAEEQKKNGVTEKEDVVSVNQFPVCSYEKGDKCPSTPEETLRIHIGKVESLQQNGEEEKQDILNSDSNNAVQDPLKITHATTSGHPKVRPKVKNKKFQCPYCSYGSKWSGNLKSHMGMKHPKEGDRRFACPYCPHKAVYKSALRNHVMIHTGEKPFRCAICSYRTNQKYNLVIHQRKHDSTKLYDCEHCEYKTNYKKSMQDHVVRHHSV